MYLVFVKNDNSRSVVYISAGRKERKKVCGGGGGGGVFSLSRESYFSLQRTRVTIRGEIVTISDGYDRETKVIVHHYDVNIIKVFALRSFVTFLQLNQQHQYKYFAFFFHIHF